MVRQVVGVVRIQLLLAFETVGWVLLELLLVMEDLVVVVVPTLILKEVHLVVGIPEVGQRMMLIPLAVEAVLITLAPTRVILQEQTKVTAR